VKENSPNLQPNIFDPKIVDKYQIPLKTEIFIFFSKNMAGITEFLIFTDKLVWFFRNLFLKNDKDI
jgi:hypothetical protein